MKHSCWDISYHLPRVFLSVPIDIPPEAAEDCSRTSIIYELHRNWGEEQETEPG